MKIHYFVICSFLLLSACAQVTNTRGASFVDPAFNGPVLSSIIVDVRTDDLMEREAIESSATKTLQSTGLQAERALDVVPPTREAGETIRRRKMMNSGVQAVLEVIPGDKQIIRNHIRGGFGRHRDFARDRYYERYHDPFYDPPLILEEPEARYKVTLYALPRYEKIWTADFTTRGPTGMSFEELGANFGREMIERLAQDGIIPKLP